MCFVGKYNVFLQKHEKTTLFSFVFYIRPQVSCIFCPMPGRYAAGQLHRRESRRPHLVIRQVGCAGASFTLLPKSVSVCKKNPDIMHKEYVGKRIIHLFICNFADHDPPTVPAIRHHSADIGNPLSSLFRFLTCTCPLNSLCSGLPLNFRIRTPSFPPPPV